MDDGNSKRILSIDRAAFLLLRVKKAFKKKRQQRKDRILLLQNNEAITSAAKYKRTPPPLLRSRTLPAILQDKSDKSNQVPKFTTENVVQLPTKPSVHHQKPPKIALTIDDSPIGEYYRRKSSGSSVNSTNATIEPYIYNFQELERNADNSLVLRVPPPHIVAAHAYLNPSISVATSEISLKLQQQPATSTFYRFTRFLNSKPVPTTPLYTDETRRLSWEKRQDAAPSRIPRSTSIDSMVDLVWNTNEINDVEQEQINPSKNLTVNNETPSRRESLLSPRRTVSKQIRGINELTLPSLLSQEWNETVDKGDSQINDKTSGLVSQTMDFLVPTIPSSNNKTDKRDHKHDHQNSTQGGGDVGSGQRIGEFNYTKNHQQKHNENQENHHNVKLVPKDYSNNQMNQNKVILANNQQIMSTQKMNKKHKFRHSLKDVPEQNLHLHALFAAVEHGHLDKVRTILESTDVDINSVNSDGLSTLDVSVLSNNRSMTKLLLQHGALSGPQSSDNLGNYLNSLMFDAEQKVHDLAGLHENPIPQNYNTRASFSSIIGSTSHSCTGTENDKQIGLWERRIKGLKRMILGWEQSRPPDPPFSFTIDVIGTSSVMIKILEPTDDSICTKFKVQWSSREDFSNIIGERLITEWNTFQGTMGANFYINELIQGRRYYFRACSGNIKGFGPYKTSDPTSLIPSSWRDIDRREHRFTGRQRMLDELLTAVRLNRPDDASEIPDTSAQRRNPKKKTTIKQLFSAASKFQKNLRRGIYLACIMYYDDKILVTNEDFLPVIEIDETYPSNFNNDYYWLMKIACTWDDVKLLRSDMEKNPTSAIHFRTKLLGAVHQMQSALCISDLGQFYHKPLRDSHGTVVLCCINNVKNPKVSVLNSRWVPINKIQKKLTLQLEDSSMNEILLNSIQEQINYNQTSNVKLSRGLYLGYLKMQSSFEHISLVVPTKTPNVLPHCKIRDNPHISAEEWSIIKSKEALNIPLHFDPLGAKPTEVQENFLESLTLSSNRLFKYMNVTADNSLLHRLFDVEVIELNHDVSFLVICPPADSACAIPGQTDFLLKRTDLMCLPLIPFEMIHLRTYQHNIIQKYSRLSCIIELDVTVANHNHREAFSSSEVQTTKERLIKLQDLMNNLNMVWKSVRWLMDVISFARDKDKNPELDMKKILEFKIAQPNHLPHSHSALLEPPSKDCRIKSPTRGSWPGPSTTNSLIPNSNTLLCPEHSKSEQQLLISSPSSLGSRHLSVASCLNSGGSRKNSGDSIYSNYYSSCEQCDEIQPRLPPSKSEDTLVVIRKKGPTNLHRKRATTASNPITTGASTTTAVLDGQTNLQVKSGSLIVHRKNIQSMIETTEQSMTDNLLTPSKTKLRVSHHPSNSNIASTNPFKRDIKKQMFEGSDELTLVTFLKPTLTAIQNESHNRSYKDPLLIVEDEAIEMLSSPFRKTPAEQIQKQKNLTTNASTNQQLFGNNMQFIRSNVHSKITEPICQNTDTQSIDWGTVTITEQTQTSNQTSDCSSSRQSDYQTEETNLMKNNNNNNNDSTTTSPTTTTTDTDDTNDTSSESSILQVFAAYDTGLASGTSLKLRCTQRTTAREVIDLVVKQLNMAVVLKGKDGPVYEQLDNFCLVAVIGGARERCLRDDFKPLQLQNPWQKGKLYVRLKNDLLAAIEHSNRETFLI